MPDSTLPPHVLRKSMDRQRQALTQANQNSASLRLALRIGRHPAFKKAKTFTAYSAAKGEIDLAPLIRLAQQHGKQCYLPVLRKRTHHNNPPSLSMHFSLHPKGGRLIARLYGIPEPQIQRTKALKHIDFILCPLVAFDRQGNRVGMGGGFYDRALSSVHVSRKKSIWGVAHHFQQASITPQPWDKKMQGIFTDRGVITT